jgi:hypothetical protein
MLGQDRFNAVTKNVFADLGKPSTAKSGFFTDSPPKRLVCFRSSEMLS